MTDKINVIDLGSSSVRYMRISNGKILFKESEVTRLAEGVKDGYLNENSVKKTAFAVKNFCEQARAFGGEIYIFATAAVRNAKNGHEFALFLQDLTGVKPQILSGEEEAEIGLLGALKGKDGGLIDIGGGSTEIIVAKNGKIEYGKSLQVGAVNLKEEAKTVKKAREIIGDKLDFFKNVPTAIFYGVGGTVTSLTAVLLNLKEYDSKKVHGYILTKEAVENGVKILEEKSPEEIANTTCVNIRRAEVLPFGVTVLKAIFDKLKLQSVTVSESDNLEGYIIKSKGVRYER